MRARTVLLGSVIAGALALPLLAGAAGQGPFVDLMGGRCTIGLAGTDVVLTVEGVGAADTCDGFLTQSDWYEEPLGPRGALVCRHLAGQLTYTVRDTGFHLYGSQICSDLMGQ